MKKSSKSLDCIKILEPLCKEKSSFKGKEGIKALKIKEKTEPRNRLWDSTICVPAAMYTQIHDLEASLKTIVMVGEEIQTIFIKKIICQKVKEINYR